MRPTGRLHLGHYFGALINYLELQKKEDCLFMVADYHAMTTGDLSKLELNKNTTDLLLDWLSVGVDPDKAILFVQSHVHEHAELFLILSMFTSTGWLERNPTYKEQKEELGEKNTNSYGFLGYPVLQTVDVCLYKATHVPVGVDQKPHLEMGRELIRRFNTVMKKDVFPEFQALLTSTPKLPGLDGRKMSKSYGNTIDLADEPDVIRKKVQKMLTDVNRPRREDPGHPEDCTLFSYHKILSDAAVVSKVEKDCKSAVLSCGEDKKMMGDIIVHFLEPIRNKRKDLEKNKDYLNEIVKKGTEKARNIAAATLSEVKQSLGLR
jgi:tryptophanyl-tRNA synthetase